jgi:hypothetical protein
MSATERLPRHWTAALLVLVLATALLLRLNGVGFGLPALNDPDELMFEMGSVRMLSGPTLNPGWFGHPATTTIYLLALLNASVFAVGWALGSWPNPKAFADMIYFDPGIAILPGRLAMVAIGLWSIWLTWRLARALVGERVGLVAAAVLAVNPLHIAYSQVIRSDLMAVCFMLLVSLAALRIARGGGRRDHLLASLWLGLAIVTKWPFAVSWITIAGAYALLLSDHKVRFSQAARALVSVGVLALAFGLLASPFILLDYPTLLMNLAGEAQEHHLGASGGPPVANAWWYLSGPMLGSLGWAGALAAAWGAVLLVRHHEAGAVVAPPAVVFFVLFCLQQLIWERWALPLTPALSLAAGLGLVWLWDFLGARLAPGACGAAVAAALLAVLAPQMVQALVDTRVRTHDTRQAAAAWVAANVPHRDAILVEHFGFDLLQGPWRFFFPIGDAGCVDVRSVLGGKVQYDQIEEARHQRSNVDYGTMNPARRDTCAMQWAVLTQYDRYRAERTYFPRQYAAYADLLRRGRVVATFAPRAGEMGGPVVRIVKFTTKPLAQPGKMPPLRR